MSEETTLTKQTLRVSALMLVPTALFLGLISVAALAIAPAAPRGDAPAAQADGPAGAPAADKAVPRSARATPKPAPSKL